MPAKKNLIIGSGSRLVSIMRDRLLDFDYISHRDVLETDFSKYSTVFVFSWDYNNLGNNIKLLEPIQGNKIVFISTTAVLSLTVRKQWAKYPNSKRSVEQYVLNRGGKVIRLGICEKRVIERIYGLCAYTDLDCLSRVIGQWNEFSPSVVNVYDVREGLLTGFRVGLCKVIHNFSFLFPSVFVFQIFFILLIKLLRCNNYSYTGDVCKCFNKTLQIGYGAFGSFFYKHNGSSCDAVIVSNSDNVLLNTNGFKGTLIGKTCKGLSSLWHGVYCKVKDASVTKQFCFFKRSLLPFKTIKCAVKNINYNGDIFEIILTNDLPVYAKKVFLAAGPFENIRLLNTISEFTTSLSDHEIAILGTVGFEDVEGCVGKFGPFVYHKSYLRINDERADILIDIRPKVSNRQIENVEFYNGSLLYVLGRIFHNISFRRINEVIFTRFKFAFKTAEYNVYAQVLANDKIKYCSNDFVRTRLDPDFWDYCIAQTINNFKSFVPVTNIYSIDAQHVWSSRYDDLPVMIKDCISRGALVIVGSPSSIPLTSLHHTHDFRRIITYS